MVTLYTSRTGDAAQARAILRSMTGRRGSCREESAKTNGHTDRVHNLDGATNHRLHCKQVERARGIAEKSRNHQYVADLRLTRRSVMVVRGPARMAVRCGACVFGVVAFACSSSKPAPSRAPELWGDLKPVVSV